MTQRAVSVSYCRLHRSYTQLHVDSRNNVNVLACRSANNKKNCNEANFFLNGPRPRVLCMIYVNNNINNDKTFVERHSAVASEALAEL